MERRIHALIAVLGMLPGGGLLAGCGGGGGSGVDAGVDAGTFAIAPPAPPAPPVLTPCPSGWRTVDDADGVTLCDPWPVGGAATCAADEAHFPGEPGCTRVGTACPAGEWPEGLPAGQPVSYVRAGGAPGGDGSMALPFGTIAEAMAAASSGTIIAVGKGTYDESINVGAGVTLWGACVAQTIIAASTFNATTGTLMSSGAGGTVRNLQVGGARIGVLVAGATRSLHLEDVVIAGATIVGLFVNQGAVVTAHTLVVRDTAPRPADLGFGRGIEIELGGRLDLSRGVIAGNRDAGLVVAASGGNMTTIVDTAIVDTLSNQQTGRSGMGFTAQTSGALSMTRAVIERNHYTSAVCRDAGTVCGLTDVILRDSAGATPGVQDGAGLWVVAGATTTLSRVLVERARASGVIVTDAGTSLTATDVVVRDVAPGASGEFGAGLEAHQGAMQITRALVARTSLTGIWFTLPGTIGTVTDVVVRDIDIEPASGEAGNGIAAQHGPTVTVTRAVIERASSVGLYCNGRDQDGAMSPTSVVATDVAVRDMRGNVAGRYGRGVDVEDQGTLTLTRAELDHCRDVGVYAGGAATAQLTDVVVGDTDVQLCAATQSCLWTVSTSVGAYFGALIDVRRFRFTRSALLGVQVAANGAIDLHQGEISDSPIGANIQTEGFDAGRLTDEVVFIRNGVNLAADQLDVPAPSGP